MKSENKKSKLLQKNNKLKSEEDKIVRMMGVQRTILKRYTKNDLKINENFKEWCRILQDFQANN